MSQPSRSSSATVALPASGKSVSLKHVMNSATRMESGAVCHPREPVAPRTSRVCVLVHLQSTPVLSWMVV
jgi:hypothetical protein